MVNEHSYYMEKALKEAKKAFFAEEVPIGAIIVKNGRIIAKAHNLKDKKNIVTKHAEIIAIEKASKKLKNWRLNDCSIYVTLEPCPMCASAIEQSRISNLIYGTSSGNKNNSLIVNKIFSTSSISIINGILEEECSAIIRKFFNKVR